MSEEVKGVLVDECAKVQGEYKSGFTWRALSALLFSLFVFTPAAIYLNLVTIGGTLGRSVEYATLLLFAELAAIYGNPLTPQEAAIIFGPATLTGSRAFLNLIYHCYFVRSPLLSVFNVNPKEIPSWWAPPYTSEVWYLRTFFHSDWALPITVTIIFHIVTIAAGLFMGLLAREVFIRMEKLPFPMQQVTTSLIITLSERREDDIRILSVFTFIGIMYGFVYYIVPFITGLELIPKPWIDLTSAIEPYLPGAAFGITTSLTGLAPGLIIPQETLIIGILIGSILRFLIINPLLIKWRISDWAKVWVPGMNLTRIYQFSQLYFWLNPIIGVGFAVGLIPLFIRGKDYAQLIMRALKSLLGLSSTKIDDSQVKKEWFIFTFCIGIIGSILLDLSLVPDFPLWAIVLFELIMPLLVTLSAGRMIALTGSSAGSLAIPYFRQLVIIASGYPKLSAWFLPLHVEPGTGELIGFKICELTKTTISSWIKASIIGSLLSLLVGFIYTQIFWYMAPIPSGMYPVPEIQWPIEIMNTLIWITRPVHIFNMYTILSWGTVFAILLVIFWYLNVPYIIFGIASGISTPIPLAIMIFIGLILRKILIRILGKTWFLKYRAIIPAGLILGESLASIFGISIAMIIKGAWRGVY